MGVAPILGAERAATERAANRKPRIFLVQPQRLSIDTMTRFLSPSFEIAGVSESVFDISFERPLDLILIDANIVRLPEAFLADVSVRSGSVVCILSTHGRGFSNWWVPSWVQIIPKNLTQEQFVEALLRLTPQIDRPADEAHA